jgi:hypothetical protein
VDALAFTHVPATCMCTYIAHLCVISAVSQYACLVCLLACSVRLLTPALLDVLCSANKTVFAVELSSQWTSLSSFWSGVCATAPGYGMIAIRKGTSSNPRTMAATPRDPCPLPYWNAPAPGPKFPPTNWSTLLMNYQPNQPFDINTHVLPNVTMYVLGEWCGGGSMDPALGAAWQYMCRHAACSSSWCGAGHMVLCMVHRKVGQQHGRFSLLCPAAHPDVPSTFHSFCCHTYTSLMALVLPSCPSFPSDCLGCVACLSSCCGRAADMWTNPKSTIQALLAQNLQPVAYLR